mmetsp:Transcript_11422/g.22403  ORF Transcript_11422/g.22403 Transcript_11422/m.22403 type:complete len:251 (+) Transcript_11422:24-776(+)
MRQGQKPTLLFGSSKLRGAFTDSRKRSKYRQVKFKEICKDNIVDMIASQYFKRVINMKASKELRKFMDESSKTGTVLDADSGYKISRAPVKYFLNELEHKKQASLSIKSRPHTVDNPFRAEKRPLTGSRKAISAKTFHGFSLQSTRVTRVPTISWESPYQRMKLESAGIFRSYTSLPGSPHSETGNLCNLNFPTRTSETRNSAQRSETLASQLKRLNGRSSSVSCEDPFMTVLGQPKLLRTSTAASRENK